ncbi:alginate export family protein [Parahaliea mediterranea]|uniref:alginate export family protein n=1 Tax=Parahaliea mediterranea TaxID=651086 RepID=UPI000E2FE380|nr:alginate export family protein [Parahaliea mediterranea]
MENVTALLTPKTGSAMPRALLRWQWLAIFTLASAEASDGPPFEAFRWNEEYRYLAKKTKPTAYERLKYAPFSTPAVEGYISIGGSVRSRVNGYNNDLFGLTEAQDGAQWLQRFYGHADVQLSDSGRAFFELSADYADASGDINSGIFDKDKAAVSQAFFDWQANATRLRLGRQEMALGSARLLGTRDASNVRRSYDGLRLDVNHRGTDWRVFYLQEVEVEDGAFDNSSQSDHSVWGITSSWAGTITRADIYYLGLKRNDAVYVQGIGDETRHSVGARLFGNASSWDWDIEALYQFGDFADSDIRAWTMASYIGYRFASGLGERRVALSLNIASGDADPEDGRLQTFNPMFPNLAYFEDAAIYAPQNFYNVKPEVIWSVATKTNIEINWNLFWRLEKGDAVYVRGLRPLAGTENAAGSFVAHSPSIAVEHQWSRHLGISLSYSYFFAGDVIDNAGGKNAAFLKAQAEWKF